MPTGPGTRPARGLTAIKPGDGAVVAMYGGKDYPKTQLNSATDAKMQAGSTFKPFGLIAALEQGDQHAHQVPRLAARRGSPSSDTGDRTG